MANNDALVSRGGFMGLFNWLFGAHRKPVQFHAELRGPGDFDVDVVETSKYQAAIEQQLAVIRRKASKCL